MTDTPNALEPVLHFLRQYAPYKEMLPAHQEYLAMYLEPVFYAENDILSETEEDALNSLFILKSGRVSDERNPPEHLFKSGDCFPGTILIQTKLTQTNENTVLLIARKSTICYRLKQPHIDYLMQHSSVFHHYCNPDKT